METETAMTVETDTGRCMAVGNCAAIAPAVFDQSDEDGTVLLLDAAPPEREHEPVREAALRCPAAVITLHENTPASDE
ncbi:ferredoxin [Streptomyces xinghaiensis]|uniref:ferredoxin n=1 Tax=Streptomyces xinghaiensis TaxID=1038928 RepID=UPI003413043F